MNYVKVATRPRKKDDHAALLMMELLCTSYNMLEIIGELESYSYFKHNLKRKLRSVESAIKREKDGYICQMFDIATDNTIKLVEGRRSIMKQICLMPPEEVETVNLVLKAVEQNRGNHAIINNFVKKLFDKAN